MKDLIYTREFLRLLLETRFHSQLSYLTFLLIS